MNVCEFDIKQRVKMIVSDFDGIFTDGCVYISSKSQDKKLCYHDIMGIHQALINGIDIAIISGEKSAAIDYLKEKFPKIEVFQGIRDKICVLKELLEAKSLSSEDIIYIGDDVNDLKCLNFAKYKVTVPNANYKIKSVENIQITKSKGGNGAFREIVDKVLEL